jgi:hypothetical protein
MDQEQRDEHKPREWLHPTDPPTVIANEARRRYVVYACQCGSLHKVTPMTFLKRAA